jgi:hypothetical protein
MAFALFAPKLYESEGMKGVALRSMVGSLMVVNSLVKNQGHQFHYVASCLSELWLERRYLCSQWDLCRCELCLVLMSRSSWENLLLLWHMCCLLF